ncbi:MAG: hypothetical protein AAFN05_04125, partial [Pseudomonadota bacterium]
RPLPSSAAPVSPDASAERAPGTQPPASERAPGSSTARDPAPAAARDALLDDVERFLSITDRDLTLIEELLNDG